MNSNSLAFVNSDLYLLNSVKQACFAHCTLYCAVTCKLPPGNKLSPFLPISGIMVWWFLLSNVLKLLFHVFCHVLWLFKKKGFIWSLYPIMTRSRSLLLSSDNGNSSIKIKTRKKSKMNKDLKRRNKIILFWCYI